MQKSQIGKWSRLFGQRLAFEQEISKAKEFNATWRVNPGPLGLTRTGCTDVDFSGLPGWLHPLWASDGEWLYVRRPEGVWKSKIPHDLLRNAPVHFIQKKVGQSGIMGRTYLSFGLEKTDTWMDRFGEPSSPDEIDADCELAWKAGIEVDFYAPPLINPDGDADRLIAPVGDLFCSPPKFSFEGSWLVATDRENGWRCAFPLFGPGSGPAGGAMNDGLLWLRFEGEFLDSFEVKVSFEDF